MRRPIAFVAPAMLSGIILSSTVFRDDIAKAAGLVHPAARVATSSVAAARSARVATVLTVKGPISGLALDGDRMVWIDAKAPCSRFLHVLDLRTRKVRPAPMAGTRCGSDAGLDLHAPMALAGTRVLYGWDSAGNEESDVTLQTTDTRTGKVGDAGVVGVSGGINGGAPFVPVPLDGSGSLLLYGNISNLGGTVFNRVVNRLAGRGQIALAPTYGVTSLDAEGVHFAVARQVPAGCECNRSPTWSADGRIAFVTGRGPDGSEGATALATMTAGGAGLRTLVAGEQEADAPSWSRDGKWLAYLVGSLDNQPHLEVQGPTGAPRDLGVAAFPEYGRPSWSPDGTKLAFTVLSGSTWVTYAENRDGTGRKRVTTGREPSWSPDGKRLVVVRDGGTWTVDANGTHAAKLPAGDDAPSWAPDGSRIAVADPHAIEIVRPATGSVDVVASLGSHHDSPRPRWSPDGTRLVYGVGGDIYVVPADGSAKPLQVGTGADPDWSPAGTRIVYARGPGREIATVKPDGTGGADLTRTTPAAEQDFVEVRTANDKLVSRAHAKATAVLVSGPNLVDLTASSVEFRRVTTGALVRRLPRIAAYPIDGNVVLAGRWLVSDSGRQIILVDVTTGHTRVLAKATGTIVGLSASGDRIAWAESGKTSRIRSVVLG